MADAGNDLTLGQLLERGLAGAQRVTSADTPNDPAVQVELSPHPQGLKNKASDDLLAQKLISSSLSDLTLCSSLVNRLGIFSPNETVEDINTRDLRCLLIDCMRGELEVAVKTTGGKERISWISKARDHFRAFVELVDRYELVPQDRRKVFAGPQHSTQDVARRRESKIAQFKMEREIKGKLEELRRRRVERRGKVAKGGSGTGNAESVDDLDFDSDDDDAEVSRPLILNLVMMHYIRAHTELASIDQELELLQHGMAMSDLPSPGRDDKREGDEDDSTWRLDQVANNRDGPLLDSQGKVLRPFTILPSTTNSPLSTRLRLQSEVFRPGHRLPTMTIDEFLDQERENGNILQGGGPASKDAVDEERREKQAEKEDDTNAGYERDEEEIVKTREWDDWKDTHRRGEGNMHNRG